MYSTVNNLYNLTSFKDKLVTYNGLNIPFDMAWTNIGVNVSGGADSGLLCYLLCDTITKNNLNCTVHVIYNIRCWKTRPWQEHVAKIVFDKIVEKFPNITFKRHINFVPPDLEHSDKEPYIVDEYGQVHSGDTIELRAFSEYVTDKNNIDAVFNAVTKNPKIEIAHALSKRNVEPSESNIRLMLNHYNGFFVCHPFRFVSKDYVVAMYAQLNILDLFELTRSCEGEFTEITHKTYTPGQYVPLCQNCFWCKERTWAINEIIQKQQSS